MQKKTHTTKQNSIVRLLKNWPLHIILLPAYFVISIYIQLAGLLHVSEIAWAFVKVLMGILILFAILYFFFRDINKAAVLTTIAGTLILFFGNIKDILAAIPVISYISSYTALVFILPAILILYFFRIKKSVSLVNTTLFLNLLLFVYLGMEAWKWNRLKSSEKSSLTNTLHIESSDGKEKKPDIYFIVLDSYPSSQYQKEVLKTAYNSLDTALLAKGFYVVSNSKSNYHLTSFSIAATLQMQYLNWLKNGTNAKPKHYNKAASIVKNSITINWLTNQGYELYNLSVFDRPGHPSVNKERFFSTTSDEIIYYNTLWNRIKWQIIPAIWPVYIKQLEAEVINNNKTLVGKFKDYNLKIIDSLRRLPFSQLKVSPKFVYAHLEMPHYPYFYDSTGKLFPEKEVFSASMKTDKHRFKNYIAYTNSIAISLADIILNYNKNSIIIIQSDHGTDNIDETRMNDNFTNFSSFYFPDRDYQMLYDSMSNVNTFRVIFNKYFNQQLPILADSSINIKEE